MLSRTTASLLRPFAERPRSLGASDLGTFDLQTTLGYTHVLPGWQRDAMKRLETVVLFPNVPKSEKESETLDSELVGVPAR